MDEVRINTGGADAKLAAGLFLGVCGLSALYGGSAAGDDTFIYMRYVGNALAGDGYTFNPGEASSGITSLSWAYLMTPSAAIFGNTIGVWRAVSIVLGALRAPLMYLLLRREFETPRGLAGALAAIACIEPHGFRWSSSGMENSLAMLALVGVAWLYFSAARGRSAAGALCFGALLGALPFIRPEFCFLAIILAALSFGRGNRPAFTIGSALLSSAGFAAIALATFGAILPQTAEAKSIVLGQSLPFAGLWGALRVAASGAGALAVVLVARWASLWRTMKGGEPADSGRISVLAARWALAAALSATIVVLYLAAKNLLVSTRYGTSLATPLVLAGVFWIAAEVGRGSMRRLVIATAVAQAMLSIALLFYLFPVTRNAETKDIQEFVEETAALVPAGARVAITEVGAYGFFSERYVIDLLGLIDRASLELIRKYGNPNRDLDSLEAVLLERGATHYISCFDRGAPLAGRRLAFELLFERDIERNNYSGGRITLNHWRLYRLSKRDVEITSKPD